MSIKAYLTSVNYYKKNDLQEYYGEALKKFNPDYESHPNFVIITIKDLQQLIELSANVEENIIISAISNINDKEYYQYGFSTKEEAKEAIKAGYIMVEIYDGYRE